MTTAHMPAQVQVGDILLRLDQDAAGYFLQAMAAGSRPLSQVLVKLRGSPLARAAPAEFRFGTLPVGMWTAAERINLQFDLGPLRSLPETVLAVYVLEFDVHLVSGGERMTGAFHIAFG